MTDKIEPRQRRPVRIKARDFAQPGVYLVTVYTYHKDCLFGQVVDGIMKFNRLGLIVRKTWLDMPHNYPHVALDAFCVMPNLIQGIVVLVDDFPDLVRSSLNENGTQTLLRQGLSAIVKAFKSNSTQRVKAARSGSDLSVWQRSYRSEVVHDGEELERLREVIENKPKNWSEC